MDRIGHFASSLGSGPGGEGGCKGKRRIIISVPRPVLQIGHWVPRPGLADWALQASPDLCVVAVPAKHNQSRNWGKPSVHPSEVVTLQPENQRRRDDNKNKICAFEGVGLGDREENRPNTLFLFHGKGHDNKMLKVLILLPRKFVVIAQAPRKDYRYQFSFWNYSPHRQKYWPGFYYCSN